MAEQRFYSVATVRRPHGIGGEFAVSLDTDHPDQVFRPGRTLRVGTADATPTNRQLTLRKVRPFKGGLLVMAEEFSGLTDELEAMRGMTLLIPEAEAAPLGENEVFYHQLPGMRVLEGDGVVVGTIREILPAPASDLLLIDRDEGGELLVPYISEVIRTVDPVRGEVTIEPPEGLLEL